MSKCLHCGPVCRERQTFSTCNGIPQPDSVAAAGGGQDLAIHSERQGIDGTAVGSELSLFSSCLCIPQLHLSIQFPHRQDLTISREGKRGDLRFIASRAQTPKLFS